MYIINNIIENEKIYLKKSNYISILSDDTIFSKWILNSFYEYFSKKRDSSITILNGATAEKEQISSIYPIFIENTDIENEIELGSKTVLYKRLLTFLKEKFPIEPTFSTLNILIENFFEEEIFQKIKSELTLYSEYSIDFKFTPFSPVDIIKKLEVRHSFNDEIVELNQISHFDRLKLKISYFTVLEECLDRDKIYLLYYPESYLNIDEIKKLKLFLTSLSQNNSTIIIATNSKYLLGNDLDSLNIFKNKKLLNFKKISELKENLLMNYPQLKEWERIEERLTYLVKNYILEDLNEIKITNRLKNNIDEIYLNSFEDIFLLTFYLYELGLNYQLDLNYNERDVFSNYINRYFNL